MIKKLLSSVLLITGLGVLDSSAQAICTPDITCVPSDSTFGICPDSMTGIPAGILNQAYTVTMSIKLPATSIVLGQTVTLSHLALTEVLADTSTSGTAVWVDISAIGLTYLGNGANTPSGGAGGIGSYTMTKYCYWDAPGQSCVIVSGTPTKAGDFPIKIKSKGRGVAFGIGTWANATENNNYKLHVVDPAAGIESLNLSKFDVGQNMPNPFSSKSEIGFTSVNNSDVEFKVYDMLGAVVYTSNFKSVKGMNTISLDANSFAPGVYMYSVKNGAITTTKRMVVSSK
ncbi:MAG: T9SS type A sorting domain-containing protein [Bacteroidota bacterium]|nr:T9SS type A sorting domain-containing protein [Bacteroidota bacterium]